MAARVVLLAELTDDSKEQYNCRNDEHTAVVMFWGCLGSRAPRREYQTVYAEPQVPLYDGGRSKERETYDGVSHFALGHLITSLARCCEKL